MNQRQQAAIIRGVRVYLRAPTARDAAEFVAAVRGSRTLHAPWVTAPDDTEKFKALLERARQTNRKSLLVCRKSDGAIVGLFNISEIVRGGFQSAYLGYYAMSHAARAGYMTEGLQLALRFAFREMKLHRLEANIQPGNDASMKLARRCGFVLEGYSKKYLKIRGKWRDHMRWAITVEQWLSHPPNRTSRLTRHGSRS
ncbi:MAG: GNAT family N-acetyltransferase [Tepidisphaeraceae bacterium]